MRGKIKIKKKQKASFNTCVLDAFNLKIINIYFMKDTNTIFKVNSIPTNIHKLHPYNVTGYFDGEGCFNISIYKNKKAKIGYSVSFTAEIKQHSNSRKILFSLKNYFNGKGNISYSNKTKTVSRYKLSSLKDILNLVIPHFDKYPLITSKHLNYLDFKKAILLIVSGEHLNEKGIIILKKIISNMNTKRSFLEK
jgi:hypothetical protein